MRRLVLLFALLFAGSAAAAPAGPSIERGSKDAVVPWIYGYRLKPEPQRLPSAIRTLSKSDAFKDPEQTGVYVGFIAGVIAANPTRAEELLEKAMPLPAADQWVIVRAIAYSGLSDWKERLARMAPWLAARQPMINRYLSGTLPPLDRVPLDSDAALLDTLWGFYYATGSYLPIARMVTHAALGRRTATVKSG